MPSGFSNFFNKGSDEAASRGDDVVRLRFECIVQFLYYVTITIIFFLHAFTVPAVVACLAALVQVYVFVRTYGTQSRFTRMAFLIVMFGVSVYYSAYFGMTRGFQYFMYLALILILLETHMSSDTKVFVCAGVILTAIILNALPILYSHSYPIEAGSNTETRLRLWNEMALAFNVVIIGLSYTRHQVEAERQLFLANQKLKLAADTDPLTRLPNRRAMLEVLAEIDRDKDDNISIAIGDIDHFKVVNDTYGHDAGDEVLKTISNLTMRFMDKKGYCARWGGEEFLLVFSSTNGDEAYLMLDHFRRKIGEAVTEYEGNKIQVTMTFGLEEHGFFQTTDKTIKDADDKLYTGKNTGRNKVVY